MSNEILDNNYIYVLYPELIKFPQIIKVLVDHRCSDGITYITQKQISSITGISQIGVPKYIKKLAFYDGCVEQLDTDKYIVHKEDMLIYGPVSKVLRYTKHCFVDEFFVNLKFKEQVKTTEMTRDATLMSKHYFVQLIKKIDDAQKSNPEANIDTILKEKFEKYIKWKKQKIVDYRK